MSDNGSETSDFWSDQHLTVRLTAPDGSHTTHDLSQPFALVGAHAECDVQIADNQLDNRSLLVCLTRNGLAAVVLAPRSKKAGHVVRIETDQTIPLRDWSVSFCPAGSSRPAGSSPIELSQESSDYDAEAKVDQSLFCLTWKSTIGRQYLQLRDELPMLIGRKAPADLILNDDRLSSVHCCVLKSLNRLWVIDLASTNGTWSGGVQRRVHQIEIDKSVCLGKHRLHFTRLRAEQEFQQVCEELDNVERNAEATRRSHLQLIDDTTMQQAGLVTSLRQTQEQNDQLREQIENEAQRHESRMSSQHQALAELEQQHRQLVGEQTVLQEELAKHSETESELQAENDILRGQVEELERKRRELDAQLANREMDLALREKELDRLAEEVAEQRREADLLKDELVVERRILATLELELGREDRTEVVDIANEEHCVASPDFHAILDEALESLPRLDES